MSLECWAVSIVLFFSYRENNWLLGWAPFFSPRDGKIGVHKIHSTFTVKYAAHEQEVNCVDCKGGIIVSGSRDRTAKVRWSLPYTVIPSVYREWVGEGG